VKTPLDVSRARMRAPRWRAARCDVDVKRISAT
jgi:hypothetical protein